MLAGQPPFDADTEEELFPAILRNTVLFPVWLSKESVECIKSLLVKDPKSRLGSRTAKGGEELFSDPFFAPVDWVKLEARKVEPPVCIFDALIVLFGVLCVARGTKRWLFVWPCTFLLLALSPNDSFSIV